MQIPIPPTDSLYKFIALSGIALILLSLIYPSYLLQQLEPRAIDASTNVKILEFETKQLEFDVDALKASKTATSETLGKIKERTTKIQLNLFRAEGENSKVTFYSRQARLVSAGAFFFLFSGIFIAVYGFWLWYVNVQRPADRLAAMRVRALDP